MVDGRVGITRSRCSISSYPAALAGSLDGDLGMKSKDEDLPAEIVKALEERLWMKPFCSILSSDSAI